MSTEAHATVESVTKLYRTEAGTVEALHDVDAVFPAGAVTAVVGVSGSGKSTLLRLLAGLDRATSGRVAVGGRELGSMTPSALRAFRRSEVAYVSQRAADNLFPHLTIAEHAPGEGARSVFDAFGIGSRVHARPAQLSGGELARAAFAVALAQGAALVIADESTAELDRESAAALLTAIGSPAAAGTTFVLATHDPDVLAVADHVVRLDRGRNATGRERASVRPPRRPPDAPVIVCATGLTKTYGDTVAVADATFDLHAGELAAVVGRSGSGKSTLLMLLGGWQSPDSGSIEPAPSERWSESAFLPQRFGLLPELTVRENIELPVRLAGRVNELRDSIEGLLDRLGLRELADRRPLETSIGQQQRAAVARAVVLDPRLLLVDEPTSHQDPLFRDRVWSLLHDAAERGVGCLVVTHEPGVDEYAHTTWQLDEGRLRGVEA